VSDGDIVFGAREKRFRIPANPGMSTTHAYAPALDGQRFLVIRPVEAATPALRLMSDWRAALPFN
jgi:hypothetical protein